MSEDSHFEMLPVGEMRAKYGLTAGNRPTIKLDPANVPERLRFLIPLAEWFGVSDDLMRMDLMDKTPQAELHDLHRLIQEYDCHFDDWLAGPAVNGPTYSEEYIAFTCMRMLADGC